MFRVGIVRAMDGLQSRGDISQASLPHPVVFKIISKINGGVPCSRKNWEGTAARLDRGSLPKGADVCRFEKRCK